MNINNYNVTEQPATKIVVTISRKQLWENFVNIWSDMAWDDYSGIDLLKEVADVLLSEKGLSVIGDDVCQLFKDGNTIILMGSAMDKLDVPNNGNLLREIVVQDVDSITGEVSDSFVIHHEFINF
jgi:hypothetical protein